MRIDAVGNAQKAYEKLKTENYLMPDVPHLCRIDGKAFHGFCRGLDKPFDEGLKQVFSLVLIDLLQETGANIAYYQSDEISLAWTKGVTFFEGKVHKMVSVIASMATYYFNEHKRKILPSSGKAFFDCRVWVLPNIEKAAEYFMWRELDAIKNSISSAASTVYSHLDLMGKNSTMRREMLKRKGILWEDYCDEFKRGIYYIRKNISTPITEEELKTLPPQHHAVQNPDLLINRSTIQRLEIPFLSDIENVAGVLFDGEDPIRCDR